MNRSKRDLYEAKIAKLLLKLVSQVRIIVKESDKAKEQYSKLVNDVAINKDEKILNFNKFMDKLDTFYAHFILSIHELAAVWKVLK